MSEPQPEGGIPEESLRGALRKALSGDPANLDFIVQALLEACKPQVNVRINDQPCTTCGCKHVRYALVPRYKEAVELAIKLMDQVEGRPGVADGVDAGVVVKRIVVGLDVEPA